MNRRKEKRKIKLNFSSDTSSQKAIENKGEDDSIPLILDSEEKSESKNKIFIGTLEFNI